MHIKDVRDLSKKLQYVIFEKTKKTQNKLYAILKSVISTIRYKKFEEKICGHIWENGVWAFLKNVKFELLFTENSCFRETLLDII